MKNTKPYLIDDMPVTGNEIINYARDNYAWEGVDNVIFSTSGATQVLRENGHTVGYNPKFNQEGGPTP